MTKITKQALVFFFLVNVVLFGFTHLMPAKAHAVDTASVFNAERSYTEADAWEENMFDYQGFTDRMPHPFSMADVNKSTSFFTGGVMYVLIPIGSAVVMTLIYAYYDYVRHKKPLAAENPHIHYTFWHHLRVVTLPIMKYRLSIVVDRGDSTQAAS